MRRLLLSLTLIALTGTLGIAQKTRKHTKKPPAPYKAIAVAFYDESRLRERGAEGELTDFQYFFKDIQQIAVRDFPNVELKVLQAGELLHLPDGTNLNVQNMRPDLGYVLSATGKKARILTGVQSEADFACAASTFFKRPSSACPK